MLAVPRKNPIPETDLAIARRLVELREMCRISRKEWAKRSGIKPDLLARFELGRVPLRYDDARKLLSSLNPGHLADLFPLNPLWLAEGTKPIQLNWPMFMPDSAQIGLSPGASFSGFAAANRDLLLGFARDVPEAGLPQSWLQPYLYHWAALQSKVGTAATAVTILGCVVRFSAKRIARRSPLARRLLRQFDRIERAGSPGKKKSFTPTSEIAIRAWKSPESTLNAPLKNLLERLNRATCQRGRKAELANFLRVPRPCVYDWLSGKRQPGGNITLRLLQWVEERERQQPNSPGAASTAPEQQTQSRKSSHEKPKSGPKTR
jgi:DNA-binding transcriptional regulator YiaG